MAYSAVTGLLRFSPLPSSLQNPTLHFNRIGRFIASTVSGGEQHHRRRFFNPMASTAPAEGEKLTAPYGSWKSPITADVISAAEKRLGGTAVDGSGRLFLLESRPKESGRSVLVKDVEKLGEEPIDVTPEEFSVRTSAQEYGGGAFAISGDTLIFSNYKDQRLYKQSTLSADQFPSTHWTS